MVLSIMMRKESAKSIPYLRPKGPKLTEISKEIKPYPLGLHIPIKEIYRKNVRQLRGTWYKDFHENVQIE